MDKYETLRAIARQAQDWISTHPYPDNDALTLTQGLANALIETEPLQLPQAVEDFDRTVDRLANHLRRNNPREALSREFLQLVLAEMLEQRERKDGAYSERNRIVAALARCFPSGVMPTDEPGWDPEWRTCVYIDLPTGQASWHFHDQHLHLIEGLPMYWRPYDEHTTDEKYDRLEEFCKHPLESRFVVAQAMLDEAAKVLDELRAPQPDDPTDPVQSLEFGRYAGALRLHEIMQGYLRTIKGEPR
jgi:hypothetical protein